MNSWPKANLLEADGSGLAPFTALLGALAVQDEMQLQFRSWRALTC